METTIKEKNILLVDDEIDILKLLGTVLNKEGFKNVYKAETGNEAINIFKNNDIDIVVLDIMLPDKEGYEVFKEIRQISQVPVLFLSAKTEEMDRVLGLALGADDYITKPFSPKEVALRIKLNLKKNLMLETKKDEDTKEKLVFGPFEIDEDSVEVKKNEKGIIELAQKLKVPFEIITLEEIKKIEDKFQKSEFVKKSIGVYCVAEPVAYILSNNNLIVEKHKYKGITFSIGRISL